MSTTFYLDQQNKEDVYASSGFNTVRLGRLDHEDGLLHIYDEEDSVSMDANDIESLAAFVRDELSKRGKEEA